MSYPQCSTAGPSTKRPRPICHGDPRYEPLPDCVITMIRNAYRADLAELRSEFPRGWRPDDFLKGSMLANAARNVLCTCYGVDIAYDLPLDLVLDEVHEREVAA